MCIRDSLEDALATGFLQRIKLQVRFLIARGDACVADQHLWMSVRAKSLPTNSSGSPSEAAKA